MIMARGAFPSIDRAVVNSGELRYPSRIPNKTKKNTIEVQGAEITVLTQGSVDYISLTDMLKAKDGAFFISDWLRNAMLLNL